MQQDIYAWDPAFAEKMLRIFDELLADVSEEAMIPAAGDEKFFSMGAHVDWLEERFH